MKILITGGEGFIGKYVQARCAELGIETVTYDIVDGKDVLDRNTLMNDINQWPFITSVIHLAGMLGTHELWDDRDRAIDVNIKGALNVADAALAVDAKLVSIEQPHIWYNVYEATKGAARRMLTGLHYDRGLRVDFVTAHNAYGPGQAYGDGHPQKIIPTFATKAWLGEPIPVWGDGEQKVNLVYAGDVADMLVQRALVQGCAPLNEYHAGVDYLMTVNSVVGLVVADAESDSTIEYVGNRSGEQNALPYPAPDDRYPYKFKRAMLRATVESYKP